MAASFTSWTALAAAIKDSLARRDLTLSGMTGPDGTAFTYRSISELEKILVMAERRAALETNPATEGVASRRTYAKAARW